MKSISYGAIQQLRGQNFAIYWHRPPSGPLPAWTVFIPWAWTKRDIFWPPPPHLVHVVIEWPLWANWQIFVSVKFSDWDFVLVNHDFFSKWNAWWYNYYSVLVATYFGQNMQSSVKQTGKNLIKLQIWDVHTAGLHCNHNRVAMEFQAPY